MPTWFRKPDDNVHILIFRLFLFDSTEILAICRESLCHSGVGGWSQFSACPLPDNMSTVSSPLAPLPTQLLSIDLFL